MNAVAPLLLALVISGPAQKSGSPTLEINGCRVTAIREVQVPARQPGVLADISAEEGVMVEKGQQIAQIDDTEAKLRLIAAQREYEAAKEQAREDVDVQAAEAAAEVAHAEEKIFKTVNDRAPGALADVEYQRAKLTSKRADLQIKVAKMEYDVAVRTAESKEAMKNVGSYDVDSRKILAPFSGLIGEHNKQAGEWVMAGDSILKIVQMDRLRVQGLLKADQYTPNELEGRPVVITILLPGAREQKINGVIGYVSQDVEVSNTYRSIWAEFDNEQVDTRENRTYWLAYPGLQAKMEVDLSK